MKLPALAIRRPVFMTIIFVIITLFGMIAYWRLPVDLMPDMSMPMLTVSTAYTGVGPQEIEELVTVPMERALSSTPGLEEISSTSSEGSSQIRLAFTWGTDLDEAADEVRTRIDRSRASLPEDASTPTIFKFDTSAMPILFLGVSSAMDPGELREFIDKQLLYRFERIPGVASAQVWGGLQRQIHVELDRNKIHALRISPTTVINALRRENLNEPAGEVVEGDFETLMTTEGQFRSLDELQRTMVARRQGNPIYVADIAKVEDGFQEVRNLVRINGEPGIRMAVIKQSGANTVTVAAGALDEVERINRDFPQLRITVISDSSKFIKDAVSNLGDAAIMGSILAVLVLLLFLRNIRSTLVIAITIPLTVIATFALMFFAGFTLNTITFGGLALGVGMLVDNAIVVLENIFRHRQAGTEPKEAARKGTSEVGLAIVASTLTTVVVFVPVVFMTGIAAVMFQQMAWVVTFAQVASLLIALTLLPLLASRMVRVEEPDPRRWAYKVIHGGKELLDRLDAAYARGIGWSLRHRLIVISGSLAIFLGSLLLIPLIGFELQPETDEGEVSIDIQLAEGTRLEVTDAIGRRVEDIVRNRVPEATRVLTEIGSAGGFRSANTNTVNVRVTLSPQAERQRSSQEIAQALRPELARIPGVITRVRSAGQMFGMMMGRGMGGSGLSLDIRGFDIQETYALAVELKRLMEDTPGVSDATISRTPGRPENKIQIDREKAAALGLSVSDVATTIRTSVAGTRAGMYREKGDEYEILVRFMESDRLSNADVQAIPLQTPQGSVIPLSTVVSFERKEGPISISRKDQQRVITVNGNLDGTRDMGSVTTELQQKIQSLNISPEMAVVFSGASQDQAETFRLLAVGLLLAIVLVYGAMAAEFESFKYPFIIMFALPLAAIGVVLTLFITDTTFSMQAFIGAIMLVGIAVNNAIVLIDCVLQLWRDQGMGLVDSLVLGGRRRLRPILMTTLASALGLIPMALGLGEGGELQAPMARVLIGGLMSSTLITLFLLPTLFLTMELGFRRRREVVMPAGAGSEATGD